jgi:hypothetical protein
MAIRFDNAADFFTRTASAPNQAALTAMAWVNQASQPSALGNWFSLAGAVDTDYHVAGILTSGSANYIESNFSAVDVSDAGSALSLNTWNHLAFRHSGNNMEALLNGVGDASFTSAGSFTATRFWIGNSQFTTNNLNGRVAGYLIYEAALSDAEIQAQMRQFAPVRIADLWAWYPMVDSSVAGCAVDYSGNGRNLTVNGTLTIEGGPPIAWRQGARKIFIPAALAGSAVALDAGVIGRGAVRAAAQLAVALSIRSTGRGSSRAAANVAQAIASQVSGGGRTLASSSVARTLSVRVLGTASTRASSIIARALTVRVSGVAKAAADTAVARALAVRSVGRSAVQVAFEGLGAITARIQAGARVVGSISMARDLRASITGRGAARAAQNVIRALSGASGGRGAVRASASALFALTARIGTGAAAKAAQAVVRAISSAVQARASVRANLPPLFQEVVGIVRSLIRVSMRVDPIIATAQIRRPIVINASNMIAQSVALKDYVIGDDTEIAFQLTIWPAGVVLAKAYFTMKQSLDDDDPAAIIQRQITVSLTAEGQITANGSSGTAEGYFLIRHQDAEWANVRHNQKYYFDIQPITDQATVQTPVVGTISFQRGATRATS